MNINIPLFIHRLFVHSSYTKVHETEQNILCLTLIISVSQSASFPANIKANTLVEVKSISINFIRKRF